jgi:DNA-binding NarL/FixJ family response regulator
MRNRPVALVVSADHHVRHAICASFGEIGCATLGTASHDGGLNDDASACVDFVVVDVCHADAFDSELVRELRAKRPDLPVVYLIGRASPVFGRGRLVADPDLAAAHRCRVYDVSKVVLPWVDDQTALLAVSTISMN